MKKRQHTFHYFPQFFSGTLGAFLKLQRATISFATSVRMELASRWTDCMKFDISIFRKYDDKIQVSLVYDKNNGYIT
jgi:hypothetical protein